MKILPPALALLSAVLPGVAVEQTALPPQSPAPLQNSASGNGTQAISAPTTVSPALTATQQSIEAVQRQLQINPKKMQAYNDLAIALLRRARESADPRYVNEAEHAVAQGFALDPKNFPLQKTQIAALLASHRFLEAKQKATDLNRHTPDDVTLYGYLAEADLALGLYDDAERSAQWMLNMLPNNVPGLLLAAELRTLYGDAEGALELLDLAYTETSPTEAEELAWIGNQIASVEIDSGRIEAAATILERSEQVFPRYPYTSRNLARLRLAQRRPEEAVALLSQATELDADPSILYELAGAEAAAGHRGAADNTYEKFENLASTSGHQTEASTRDLILRYASDPAKAPTALKLAEACKALREDVWTLDAYAWALDANGRYQEANAPIQKAIAVGIQSAQIFDHAGHIQTAPSS